MNRKWCVNIPRIPADTSIGQVSLEVSSLAKSRTFYQTICGLTVHDRFSDRIVLGNASDTLLTLHEGGSRVQLNTAEAGLFHLAIRVSDRAALSERLETIEMNGELIGASDHGVSEALYLRDPDDNGVEIYCDRPKADWPRNRDGTVEIPSYPLDLSAVRSTVSQSGSHPLDIGHIHLNVTDLDHSKRFYRETVGFPIQFEDPSGAVFFGAGDYHHHVAINRWHNRGQPYSKTGMKWFEIVVTSQQTLAALTDRLEDADIPVEPTQSGIEFHDPDNIPIRCLVGKR